MTRAEAVDRIEVLSNQLGVKVPTTGLNRDKLLELVDELEQRVAVAGPSAAETASTEPPEPAADAPPSGEPPPAGAKVETPEGDTKPPVDLDAKKEPAPLGKASDYNVGKCSLMAARGVLKPGTPLRDDDVDEEALRALRAAGLVVKRESHQAGSS